MMTMRLAFLAVMLLAAPMACQQPEEEPPSVRLPSGKLQIDEILKADHEKALREIDRIVSLATELKAELQKDGYQVYSLSAEKKAAEIEKLVKHVRTSIRRH
jgi:hypothetical protein